MFIFYKYVHWNFMTDFHTQHCFCTQQLHCNKYLTLNHSLGLHASLSALVYHIKSVCNVRLCLSVLKLALHFSLISSCCEMFIACLHIHACPVSNIFSECNKLIHLDGIMLNFSLWCYKGVQLEKPGRKSCWRVCLESAVIQNLIIILGKSTHVEAILPSFILSVFTCSVHFW